MNDLTTKLRPANLDELVGQDHLLKSLKKSIASKRCGAYLFNGPSGTGKTTIARIIAAGRCASEDQLEIDAASYSGAEHARSLVDSAGYQPLSGGCRSVIIDECHRLSKVAWDVFLKPFEEPGDQMVWILCTTDLSKVPVSIRNRCECFQTKAVSDDEVFEAFIRQSAQKGNVRLKKGVARLIVRHAEGSPRQALRWLAQMDGMLGLDAAKLIQRESANETVIELCRALNRGLNWVKACELIQGIEDDSESVRHIVLGYFEKVALGAKSVQQANGALAVLDAFSEPYPAGARRYPLLLSIGTLLHD